MLMLSLKYNLMIIGSLPSIINMSKAAIVGFVSSGTWLQACCGLVELTGTRYTPAVSVMAALVRLR